MRRGTRVIHLGTLDLGEIDSVAPDGRLLVWFDDRTGDVHPTPVDPQDVEIAEVPA